MIEIIKTLSDIQLPALLVIGGLIFLLVPFVPPYRVTGTLMEGKIEAIAKTKMGDLLIRSK